MKKGCALTLAMYGLPMVAYYAALHFALGAPFGDSDAVAGIAAGLFTVLGISLIVSGGDAALLRRNPRELPADGQRVAVCGKLEALGAPLHAPFSNSACIAYDYNVYHEEIGRGSRGSTLVVPHLTGLALTPSAVRWELGRTKILAYPMSEGFARVERSDAEWIRNARHYAATTTFAERDDAEVGALNLGAMSEAVSVAYAMMTENDGALRKDARFIADSDIASLHLAETVIPIGEEVCLIGRYSAGQSAFVQDGTTATRLIRGTRDVVRRTFFVQRLARIILGAIFVAAPNAAMWFLFTAPRA